MTFGNLAIRQDLRQWAEARIEAGQFASPEDLVNALLEDARDQDQKRAWLQEELRKGRESGIDPRPWRTIFADIRAKHKLPGG